MKTLEINPANISIAIVYCFFGILSFFVLKIAARYFMTESKQEKNKENQTINKKITKKYIKDVNFTKIYLKTFFMKNTLIGAFFNKNKTYLLKQILILSCMGVSCFNINKFILWPWVIGLGLSILTTILSQIIIPLVSNKQNTQRATDNSQMASNFMEPSLMGSNQIQINTIIQLTISANRQPCNQTRQLAKQTQKSPYLSFQFLYIALLTLITQIIICQCVINLSLSVSNSGLLNVVSFTIAFGIDQFIVRIGLGISSYFILFGLQKSGLVNLLENKIFQKSLCENLLQDLKKVHIENKIRETGNKVANINNPSLNNVCEDTEAKMKGKNKFEYHEQKVDDQVMANQQPDRIKDKALFEEQQIEQNKKQEKIQPLNFQVQAKQVTIKKQQPIYEYTAQYYELYPHDIQTFTQTIHNTARQDQKNKKFKKKNIKQEPKFKSDPHLYFPYEQCKLSHRNSIKHEFKSTDAQFQLCQRKIQFNQPKTSFTSHFHSHRSSVQNNYLKNIQVLQCIDDMIIDEPQSQIDKQQNQSFEQQAEIGAVLNQRNVNIKTLVISNKAQIPPNSKRSVNSAQKRSLSKKELSANKIHKKSAYLVNLQKEAKKPVIIGRKNGNKRNKQNANETNNSFMPSETIQLSRATQKQINTIDYKTIKRQNLIRR